MIITLIPEQAFAAIYAATILMRYRYCYITLFFCRRMLPAVYEAADAGDERCRHAVRWR